MPSYPGSKYHRTPDLIPSYPGPHTLVPQVRIDPFLTAEGLRAARQYSEGIATDILEGSIVDKCTTDSSTIEGSTIDGLTDGTHEDDTSTKCPGRGPWGYGEVR